MTHRSEVPWGSASIQIARLLNENNMLTVRYDRVSVRAKEELYYESVFNEVVATCTVEFPLYPNKNIASIKHMVVAKKYRNLGFGKKILLRALTNLPKCAIFSTIRKSNVRSLRIFESCGFIKVEEVRGSIEPLVLVAKPREGMEKNVEKSNC